MKFTFDISQYGQCTTETVNALEKLKLTGSLGRLGVSVSYFKEEAILVFAPKQP